MRGVTECKAQCQGMGGKHGKGGAVVHRITSLVMSMSIKEDYLFLSLCSLSLGQD